MMFKLEEFVLGFTFPGVMAHELGHMVFCRITGVEVKEYSLFQPTNPLGYVVHSKPQTVFGEFLIVMGPLFFNTASAMVIFYLTHLVDSPYSWLMLWVGFSLAFNSFPSRFDGESLYKSALKSIKKGRIYNIIYFPPVYFIYWSQKKPLLRSLLYPLLLLGLVVVFP
ncbi:MAG: metalloprotease family protein [Candidatus Altiarchaeota archaeon]|nr:metalloprotease family protein [Candidatus Altiarchaeota archaeon]